MCLSYNPLVVKLQYIVVYFYFSITRIFCYPMHVPLLIMLNNFKFGGSMFSVLYSNNLNQYDQSVVISIR